MEVCLHFINLIVLFGVCTGLTLSLLLWVLPWGNRLANQCLSLLLITNVVFSLIFVLVDEHLLEDPLFYTLFSLQMIPGPLLYFYTRIMTQQDFHWRPHYLWHLLPSLCMVTLWLWQLPPSPDGWLNLPCPSTGNCSLLSQSRFVHRAAAWISLSCYAVAAFRLMKPHLLRIKAHYSAIEDLNLRWLKRIIFSYILLTLITALNDATNYINDSQATVGGLLMALTPLAFSLVMGWFGIQQRSIHITASTLTHDCVKQIERKHPTPETAPLTSRQSKVDTPQTPPTTKKKYQTSSLSQDNAEAIWEKLQQVIEEEAPHLEHGLKISDLAEKMGVAVNHLSETINGHTKKSFYDFVNKHRVTEAIRLMSDQSQQHLSVTDIGFQAGFNSNSTFFAHFKKLHKQTPSQYRKQLTKKP